MIGDTNDTTCVASCDVVGEGDVVQQQYLCKWMGLPYSECTWEDGELVTGHFQEEVDAFLRRNSSDCVPARSAKVLKNRPRFRVMKEQPPRLGRKRGLQLRDYQLGGLNWMAYAWCK